MRMNLTNKLLASALLSVSIITSGCSGQKEQSIAQREQTVALEKGVEEHYVRKGVEEHYAKRIIDGDTLVLDDGRYVRLLGINAPEMKRKGQKGPDKYAVEATGRLENLVGKEKKIELEYDLQDKNKEDRDKFGRTLGYVIANGENTSIILVKEGYARAFMYQGLKYQKEILEVQEEAKREKLRIWAKE
jgi:endonuclease YncB( thermonuclease family)